MSIIRYAIILACIIFLQGCTNPRRPEPPVSVTRIQLEPEEAGWHKLEIVSSSKHGFGDAVGSVDISGKAAFCSDKDREMRDVIRINIYFKNLVGEEHRRPVVPEPDGTYRYSALVSVGSEGIKRGGWGRFEGTYFDPEDWPRDACLKVRNAQIMLWDTFGWIVIPKEMVDRALALPPDPERSAAWRKEKSYGWRPTLSGPQGGFKAWTY